MRLGAHPVGGVLHLKHYEGMLKYGRPIRAKSVTAEVGQHTKIDSFVKEKKKYIVSEWEDVEDWGVMVINFEDGAKATVFSSDAVLGGVRNTLNVYLSNAVVNVNINPHNVLGGLCSRTSYLRRRVYCRKTGDKGRMELSKP